MTPDLHIAAPLPAAAVPIGAAGAGALVGWVVRGVLRRGQHRLAHERALPPRGFRWVPGCLALVFAALAVSPALRGQPAATLAYLAAATALTWLVAVDLDVRRLPNAMTLPAVPISALTLGSLSFASRDPPSGARALAGGLLLAALYAVLFVIGRIGRLGRNGPGLGLGDVKLAASLGQWLAWPGWTPLLAGAYLGLLVGGLSALVLLLTGWARRDSALPHAPAMAAGALCALWLATPGAG